MGSASEKLDEIRERTVREQVDLYTQLREQLVQGIRRYRLEGNEKLANIISESLKK